MEQPEGKIEWLKMIGALLATCLLGVVYVFALPVPAANDAGVAAMFVALVRDAIPSAIVVLGTVIVTYFVLYRRGLLTVPGSAELARILTALERADRGERAVAHLQVVAFHESFRSADWTRLLGDHTGRLDIVVYYFDSWIKQNHEPLVAFFRKPSTRVRVFVADPNDAVVAKTLARLFNEYKPDELTSKVARTGERLASILREAGAAAERLEFYFVPHVLNYSAQCLDDRTLVLSPFEMYRKGKIDSPAIVIDLARSPDVATWWAKERDGLLSVAKRQEIARPAPTSEQ